MTTAEEEYPVASIDRPVIPFIINRSETINFLFDIDRIKLEIKNASPEKITVGCYGPFISLDRDDLSENYSKISNHRPSRILNNVNIEKAIFEKGRTPKRFEEFFINTDVNCAVVGEFFDRLRRPEHVPFVGMPRRQIGGKERNEYHYRRASTVIVYLLVGTGIGGGLTWGGYRVRDKIHPEMGHIQVAGYEGDPVETLCKLHDYSCVTGLASNGAHVERMMTTLDLELSNKIRADYIAQVIQSVTLTVAPTMIVLDLVVGSKDTAEAKAKAQKNRETFCRMVREAYKKVAEKEGVRYPVYQQIEDVDSYIVAPLNGRTHIEAGIAGSFYMATQAFIESGIWK